MTPEQAKALRADFPAHLISKLPKPTKKREEMDQIPKADCKVCGAYHAIRNVVHLDYVGHAAITDRLLSVDPEWNWEPVSTDDKGFPILDSNGGMWIRLTVCGVTRLGYGDAEGKTGPSAMKERIGDALRNAAMRFGVALDLWSKVELHPDGLDEPATAGASSDPNAPVAASDPANAAGTSDQIDGVKQWPIEDQEQFATLMDEMYVAFRDAGKVDKHSAEAEKWRKRMATDTPDSVLPALNAFVVKLKEAAEKIKSTSHKAA
jgi:hypothetical protein